MKKVISSILLSMAGGIAGVALYSNFFVSPSVVYTTAPAPSVKLTNSSTSSPLNTVNFTNAAEMTVHTVVNIKTQVRQDNFNNSFNYDPFYQFFFGDRGAYQQQPAPMSASGSGVIIADDGYIVTNNHVVHNAEKIEVTLNDKRTYKAELIGTDPTTDLALLKIDEKALPFINYGSSDDLKIGEWVLAVGNPFNLTSTVTAGIVSAKGRDINLLQGDQGKQSIESFIQTDAAVNPGNSGGALVNTNGELIGINTAIASNTGSYSGYSFAIPVSIVKKVMKDLLEFGTVQRAYIGISIRNIDAKLASEKNIKQYKGVYVAGLTEEGSASEAGIEEGDIITRIGEVEVNNSSELQEQVSRYRPGDKVAVTYIHNSAEKTVSVELRNREGNTGLVKKEKPIVSESLLGADFSTLSNDEKHRLNIHNGIKVTRLHAGKLRNSGIKEGFVITSIDKKPVNSTKDLEEIIENKKGGVLIEGIYQNGLRAYYGFGL